MTTTAANQLTIDAPTTGGLKYTDGNQNAGKVLTSDANGVATWRYSAVNLISGTISTATSAVPLNQNYVYTGSYIDLPPGKWNVTVTMIINYGVDLQSGAGLWIRSTFCDSSSTFGYSTDIIGPSYRISGGLIGPAQYALLQGSITFNNTTNATKRYYYWKENSQWAGSTNPTWNIYNFGSLHDENSIIAAPIL
ncbi:hypothetical protein [Cloacibacterium sp. TD35]|uniref:hypothetical protein n=1 Tax=Cloacibacterium sp. TD35 TaxID=2976818 RepID=UPI00237EBBB9|nr:hypothetical protein [Cloacibacterium sp. TD35]WDT66937.1 hypothetical protein N7277_06225 [Cloacibacterium sp. TD35]